MTEVKTSLKPFTGNDLAVWAKEHFPNDKEGAARQLGISYPTLHRQIERKAKEIRPIYARKALEYGLLRVSSYDAEIATKRHQAWTQWTHYNSITKGGK